MSADADDLLDQGHQTKVRATRVRWYALFVSAFLAGLQGGIWNTFGPVAEAVKPLLGWDNATIALLAQWGPVGFVLAVVPEARVLDRGVKAACLFAAALVLVGSVLKVVAAPADSLAFTWLMHGGQFLNALAGPIAMSVGPVLAATWFPPQERTMATSVVALMNYGGSAATFVAGPWFVPGGTTDDQAGLWRYLVAELGLSFALFCCCWLVPAQPPFPPSRSAKVERTQAWQAWSTLLRQPAFWVLALGYGIITGFMGAWGAMLGPIVQNVLPEQVAESDAGWMGFWGALASIVIGVPLANMSDHFFKGRKKGVCLTLCVASIAAYLGFTLLCAGKLGGPDSVRGWLYVTSIAAVVFANASAPFFYEMCVEATYPVAEGTTTCALTVINNFMCAFFLLVQNIPDIGTSWMNWTCVGGCVAATALLGPVREARLRLAVDEAPSPTGRALG